MRPHSQEPESIVPPRDASRETPPDHDFSQPATGPYEGTSRDHATVGGPALEPGSSPPSIRPGVGRIGMYEILEEVGHGGMGVVYKVRHTAKDRVEALKTVRAVSGLSDQTERFEREVRISARFEDHPNIMPVYEVGQFHGQAYFTMPFLTGGTLAARKKELVQDPDRVVAIMRKVARGVQHAHEHGVVHRDLKPGNVLLDDKGEPRITDFGLARFRDDLDLTRTGAVMGTLPYMAPEQAAGRIREIGPGTDVWQLGVMLYDLLVGKKPFEGTSDEEIKHNIQWGDPRPLRAERPQLCGDLEKVVLKCLEKEPAFRYRTAGALADDLQRYLQGEEVSAGTSSTYRRARRFVRRHRRITWLGAFAVLSAAVAAVAFYETRPERAREAFERKLARGQSVTLIGKNGLPAYSRWKIQKGFITQGPPDRGMRFSSFDLSLLELLPVTPRGGYRYQAEVLQLNGDRTGAVGVYFGYSDSASSGDVERRFCTWHFNDLEKTVAPSKEHPDGAYMVRLDVHACANAFFGGWGTGVKEVYPPAARLEAGEAARPPLWRTLVVKVGKGDVQLGWEGTLSQTIARAKIKESFASHRTASGVSIPDQASEPEFEPGEGVGLYVSNAEAFFRNVILEPLAD